MLRLSLKNGALETQMLRLLAKKPEHLTNFEDKNCANAPGFFLQLEHLTHQMLWLRTGAFVNCPVARMAFATC